jgi:hypothetical protein
VGNTTAEGVAETATDSASTDDVIGRLVDEAQAEGLSLTGPGRIQRVLRRLPPSFEAGTRPHRADITEGFDNAPPPTTPSPPASTETPTTEGPALQLVGGWIARGRGL